jgi:hypothetical protein
MNIHVLIIVRIGGIVHHHCLNGPFVFSYNIVSRMIVLLVFDSASSFLVLSIVFIHVNWPNYVVHIHVAIHIWPAKFEQTHYDTICTNIMYLSLVVSE